MATRLKHTKLYFLISDNKGDSIVRLFLIGLFVSFVLSSFLIVVAKGEDSSPSRVIRDVTMSKKMAALTFDDGPSSIYTPQILDILKENKSKGTFFCIGSKVAKNPLTAKRIVKEKHEIGNHTYTHPYIVGLSSYKLREEIEKTQEEILLVTGKKTNLFRPPGGRFNSRILKVVESSNHQCINWSWDQDTRDWSRPGVDRIVRKVIKNIRNGNIILFHDTNSETVKAVRIIIPALKNKGYKFVTISELIRNENR